VDFRPNLRRAKNDHRTAVVTAFELAFNSFIIIRNRDRTERVRRDRPTEWIEGLVSCDGRREEEAASGGDAVLGRDRVIL
jgi:hypothetical protein